VFLPPPETHTFPAEITRLVVFGDPHGDHAGLDAVLNRETAPGTAFLSVGDNVGYASGSRSSSFVQRLWELEARSVQGNHEDWVDQDGRLAICLDRSDRLLDPDVATWAKQLPRELLCEFEAAPGLRLLLTHTLDARQGMKWPYVDRSTVHRVGEAIQADLIVFGHTHGPRLYCPEGEGWREEELDLSQGPAVVGSAIPTAPARLFVDAGSLARPGHRETGDAHHLATYALVDLTTRRVEVRALSKA